MLIFSKFSKYLKEYPNIFIKAYILISNHIISYVNVFLRPGQNACGGKKWRNQEIRNVESVNNIGVQVTFSMRVVSLRRQCIKCRNNAREKYERKHFRVKYECKECGNKCCIMCKPCGSKAWCEHGNLKWKCEVCKAEKERNTNSPWQPALLKIGFVLTLSYSNHYGCLVCIDVTPV